MHAFKSVFIPVSAQEEYKYFPKDEDIYTGFILKDFIFEASDINFQVMVQRHNRHMSFSLYISTLAVTDTVVLICGEYFIVFHKQIVFNIFLFKQSTWGRRIGQKRKISLACIHVFVSPAEPVWLIR